MDLIEKYLANEVNDRNPVSSFTNIELVLNTDAEHQAQQHENQGEGNAQAMLQSLRTGQTSQDNATLQEMSDTTPLAGSKVADDETLKSRSDASDNLSCGSKALNDEAEGMEVDEEDAHARKMRDRETVAWMDAHQAEEEHIQAGAKPPTLHGQLEAGSDKKMMSDEEVVRWADALQAQEAQQKIQACAKPSTRANDQPEP
jgi:hypothetical protein